MKEPQPPQLFRYRARKPDLSPQLYGSPSHTANTKIANSQILEKPKPWPAPALTLPGITNPFFDKDS